MWSRTGSRRDGFVVGIDLEAKVAANGVLPSRPRFAKTSGKKPTPPSKRRGDSQRTSQRRMILDICVSRVQGHVLAGYIRDLHHANE